MRNKTGFTLGIVLTLLGSLTLLASSVFGYYACMCSAQRIGQPNTCQCTLPLSFYYPDIVGFAVLVLGLAIIVYSARKTEIQLPIESQDYPEESQALRKEFTIIGIGVAVVGALVIMIALFTYAPNCPLTRSGLFGGCFSDTVYYLKFVLGMILIVIGVLSSI